MKVVITDVNVFFDLHGLQILPEFFGSGLEIHTTDLVYNEIEKEVQQLDFHPYKKAKKLNIISISPEDEIAINRQTLKYANRSFPDKSLLYKAKQMKCPLLTGDGKLRREAEHQGVEVHGTIWVIKMLIDKGLVSNEKGVELFQQLKMINTRLPLRKIDEIIKDLKQKAEALRNKASGTL